MNAKHPPGDQGACAVGAVPPSQRGALGPKKRRASVQPWRRAPHGLAAGCAAALLLGCASPQPGASGGDHSAPVMAPVVAPQFAATAPATGSPAPELPWDQFFTDPQQRALIELALQHNRDLQVAALNVEQARAQAALREADLWPTVNLGLSGSRVPTNAGGVSTTVIGGLATSAYEVDLFGRVRQGAQAARAQLQASEFLQSAARASLIAAVAAAQVNLQADEALLSITRDTVRSREESLQIVQGRLRAGAASALDEAQAQALLQSARAALAQVERQRAADLSALVLLVGRPLPDTLKPVTAAAPNSATAAANRDQADPTPGLRLDGLSSEVLARRPDIAAAEAQLRAAQANLEAARRAFFPRITLTTSFGQASRELSSLFSGGTWVWGVAPQLLAPIFDAGRLKAGQAQAQALERAALAQYEKAVQVAFKEVSDALNARSTLREQLQALQLQVDAEAQRARLAETRWRLGASAYIEVLDAQRSLYAAQTALVQVRSQWLNSQGSLYKALGGGTAAVNSRP